MNRFATCLVAALAFFQLLQAQPLSGYLYLPLQQTLTRFPFGEIDFSSTRLQGVGYQLFNFVDDTLTALFRNPAAINTLDASLLYGNYERTLSNRLSPQLIPLAETTPPVFLDPAQFQYNFTSNSPPRTFRNSASFFRDSNSSNPGFTIGYWTPRAGWLGRPAGFFFRGSVDRSRAGDAQANIELSPGDDQQIYQNAGVTRIADLYGQIWLGILNHSSRRLGLGYSILYHHNTGTDDYRLRQTISSGTRFDDVVRTQSQERRYTSYRHRLALGGEFSAGTWKIQPELSLLLYRNDGVFGESRLDAREEFTGSPGDSLLRDSRNDFRVETRSQQKVSAIEMDLQVENDRMVLFFTGLFGRVPLTESTRLRHEINILQPSDYMAELFSRNEFAFDDQGRILRLRAGLGRRQVIAEKLNIYGAVIPEYWRFDLSGMTENHFDENESLDGVDIRSVDVSFGDQLDVTTDQFQLSVPVGVTAGYRFLTARFGLVWYFTSFHFRNTVSSGFLPQELTGSNGAEDSHREEFFGLGLHWRQYEFNLATRSEIFQFSSWQVELRYHL